MFWVNHNTRHLGWLLPAVIRTSDICRCSLYLVKDTLNYCTLQTLNRFRSDNSHQWMTDINIWEYFQSYTRLEISQLEYLSGALFRKKYLRYLDRNSGSDEYNEVVVLPPNHTIVIWVISLSVPALISLQYTTDIETWAVWNMWDTRYFVRRNLISQTFNKSKLKPRSASAQTEKMVLFIELCSTNSRTRSGHLRRWGRWFRSG